MSKDTKFKLWFDEMRMTDIGPMHNEIFSQGEMIRTLGSKGLESLADLAITAARAITAEEVREALEIYRGTKSLSKLATSTADEAISVDQTRSSPLCTIMEAPVDAIEPKVPAIFRDGEAISKRSKILEELLEELSGLVHDSLVIIHSNEPALEGHEIRDPDRSQKHKKRRLLKPKFRMKTVSRKPSNKRGRYVSTCR